MKDTSTNRSTTNTLVSMAIFATQFRHWSMLSKKQSQENYEFCSHSTLSILSSHNIYSKRVKNERNGMNNIGSVNLWPSQNISATTFWITSLNVRTVLIVAAEITSCDIALR